MANRLLAGIVLLSLTTGAWADGVMLPGRETRLSEVKPSIPSQRAVLKFDGVQEILTVESTLQGPKGRYGWVVPLPAQPTYVKAVKPAYIEGTFDQVKPRVTRLDDGDPRLPLLVSAVLAAALLTSGLRYRKSNVGLRVLLYFVEAAIGLSVLWGLADRQRPTEPIATAARAVGSMKAKGMETFALRSLGTIGSYDVTVLSGSDGRSLLAWMKRHDIPVPDAALPIIDAYAKEGWCFLASEFRKSELGPLPPHPLKAVFPTRTPIYPMRLTGLQDGPLHLEMVVVADRRANVDRLKGWKCTNDPVLVAVPHDPENDDRVFSDWVGSLYAMAKDGAVVTYLRADLSPSQMRDDYRVTFEPYERYEVQVVDAAQAKVHGLWLVAFWLPLGALIFGFVGVVLVDRSAVCGAIGGIAAIAIASFVALRWYGSVEKVDTEPVSFAPQVWSITRGPSSAAMPHESDR